MSQKTASSIWPTSISSWPHDTRPTTVAESSVGAAVVVVVEVVVVVVVVVVAVVVVVVVAVVVVVGVAVLVVAAAVAPPVVVVVVVVVVVLKALVVLIVDAVVGAAVVSAAVVGADEILVVVDGNSGRVLGTFTSGSSVSNWFAAFNMYVCKSALSTPASKKSADTPAVTAVAGDVPEPEARPVSERNEADTISSPGAQMSTQEPVLENLETAPCRLTDPTVKAFRTAAGE